VAAEDLLQSSLVKAWSAWSRIEGDPEPYVRRILVNTHAGWWRRRWPGQSARRRPDQVKMLTARATTRPRIASEISDWTAIANLAQGTRGMTSVGLKAWALVKPR
jgi:DNA-directed RNA polymerase specialized sigma24 family protein